jgi:protein tyrosine phosphatase (PTP) superfamily phosphohydrolase (DUF442 family)
VIDSASSSKHQRGFRVVAIVLILQSTFISFAQAFPGDSLIPKGMPFSRNKTTAKNKSTTQSGSPSQAADQAKAGRQSALPEIAPELTVADLQSLSGHPTEIPNLKMVSGRLLRGGQPTDQGLLLLKEAGVKTIINLRNEPILVEREKVSAEKLGLKYISIPMYTVQEPERKQFQSFLSAVTNAGETPAFVHCFHGRDRTGTMVGAYRISQGWTFDTAFKEMMTCGFRPAFAPLTQGLHKFAQARGDQSPLPSGSFIMSDLAGRFHLHR